MKRAISLVALIATAGVAFAAEIGKPAPDFTATDINGKTVHLSDYQGKIVVLESYNLDCPFCHNQYKTGAMQDLERELTAKGVVWLLVNSVNSKHTSHRSPDAAKQEWAEQKIAATAWLDDSSGAIGHEYDMKTTPHMFVIDKSGVLVYDGAIDNQPTPDHDPHKARNYVREAVEKVMAGKKVDVSKTKPYGCSVKYSS